MGICILDATIKRRAGPGLVPVVCLHGVDFGAPKHAALRDLHQNLPATPIRVLLDKVGGVVGVPTKRSDETVG